MNDKPDTNTTGRDYRETLFLPRTNFPMRAGLPQKEPEILARWHRLDLYRRLREDAAGREKFILHDGPPYANGHLHIGHALNKILKDVINRSQQMMGKDANYVPGWDCHGLPIEWKVEEQYRAQGLDKDKVPIIDFRRECREFAEHWIRVQREEFERVGVVGDWNNPYLTMSYAAEAQIAREIMKFAMTGQLYRGSKPVMWSVVERTALAEAEIEYADHTSTTIWVKFPIAEGGDDLPDNASVVIWTTTPWTIPGNRAIAYSPDIDYGLYEVVDPADARWAREGDRLIIAQARAKDVFDAARVQSFKFLRPVDAATLGTIVCRHPLAGGGFDTFTVPLIGAGFVSEDEGTGFVHTAPGHGSDDYDLFDRNRKVFERHGTPEVPHTVGADGRYYDDVPMFAGRSVLTEDGETGDANEAVISALVEAEALIARGRIRHQYPHSWRSKKPVIFRNTPQWFIHMDRDIDGEGDTLRARALKAIDETRFVPPAGRNRLRGMIETRPDWVLSRQRAWGVPITVFVRKDSGEVLRDDAVNARIAEAFEAEGADAWFKAGAKERFLGDGYDPAEWEQVTDILDVWFESGSTHSFVLEKRPDLKWPASLYLEGSDQHRGWFHSSLLESCGTRGRAPYDAVLTHGFVMDEHGRKMSKSLGNVVTPQEVMERNGADILRLWVVSSDYADDLRIGPEILKANVESYRRLRNTMRFLLANLDGFTDEERLDDVAAMPELERYVLHQLAELSRMVPQAYNDFDFKRIYTRLFNFATNDLSAFYFDIRKDALYCDPPTSTTRRACRTVLDHLLSCLSAWLAPMLAFTMEEVWQERNPSESGSVHLRQFPDVPAEWHDEALAAKWSKVRTLRRVVTGALEIERKEKRIGSSLEAAPVVYVSDRTYIDVFSNLDLAEIAITSQARLVEGEGPADAFRLEDVPGVAVVPELAKGRKCARSWKILPEVGTDPDYPDLSLRDAEAVRQYDARMQAGG